MIFFVGLGCLAIVTANNYYGYPSYGGSYYGNYGTKYNGGGYKNNNLYRGIFGNAYGQYGYGNSYGLYKGVGHCDRDEDCLNSNCPLYKPNAYCHPGADGYINACHCHKRAECETSNDCESMNYCSTDQTARCVVDSNNSNHN